MTFRVSLTAAALAAGLAIASLPVSAAGTGVVAPLKGLGGQQSTLVEKAHGWHRTCQWGLNGWHKHVPGVGRVQCTTRKCWINSWGVRRCRWF